MSLIRLPGHVHGAFRVLAAGSTLFLFYMSLVFLFDPEPQEAAQIYDYAVLIGFEFILNPLNLVLLMFSRSLLGKLLAAAFFSGFVVSFYVLMIDPQAMKYIIGSLLLVHFSKFTQSRDDELELATGLYAGRIAWYFVLLIGCVVAQPLLPHGGLDEAWMAASRYDAIRKHGGMLLEMPYVAVWTGVLYYGGILLGQAMTSVFRLYDGGRGVRRHSGPRPASSDAETARGMMPDAAREGPSPASR